MSTTIKTNKIPISEIPMEFSKNDTFVFRNVVNLMGEDLFFRKKPDTIGCCIPKQRFCIQRLSVELDSNLAIHPSMGEHLDFIPIIRTGNMLCRDKCSPFALLHTNEDFIFDPIPAGRFVFDIEGTKMFRIEEEETFDALYLVPNEFRLLRKDIINLVSPGKYRLGCDSYECLHTNF